MPPLTSVPSNTTSQASPWQDRLSDHCITSRVPPPTFNIISDRRGGRTAWSATVSFCPALGRPTATVKARFWYDGQYVNNAKEDAAEVALLTLKGQGGQAMGMGTPMGVGQQGMAGVIGH